LSDVLVDLAAQLTVIVQLVQDINGMMSGPLKSLCAYVNDGHFTTAMEILNTLGDAYIM